MDIPFRKPGKQSREQKDREERFAAELIELAESLDFKLGSRDWCYHLEGVASNMSKADFDKVEDLINSLREEGVIPIDIVANAQQRIVEGLEDISEHKTSKAYAGYLRDEILPAYISLWATESQWENQLNYIEVVVEKIGLLGLFSPVCEEFGVTITKMQGWSDLLTRATQMRRFVAHRDKDRNPVVLYFTDHDPDGLRIAELLEAHYDNLSKAQWMDGSQIDWTPDSVTVVRIGLNKDMIDNLDLTWIDGLVTSRKNPDGSERNLADPDHKNNKHAYVRDYIRDFGARKCEANALMANRSTIDAARQWLRELLPRYIDVPALNRYRKDLKLQRDNFLSRVRLTLRN